MPTICLPHIGAVAAWRERARILAAQGVPARDVVWQVGEPARDLFAEQPVNHSGQFDLKLPRVALRIIETALCHKDPYRFARAYDVILRLANKTLVWGDRSNRDMYHLMMQAKVVGREIHKMHAFVRFREVGKAGAPRRAFAAWLEPEHHIVEAGAPFFARRFGDMDWLIATPTITARFETGQLSFEKTTIKTPLPEDSMEDYWLTYYASTFNPARLMVAAMQSEMPKKYWKNLPEAALIPDLIRSAPERVRLMHEKACADTPDPSGRKKALRLSSTNMRADLLLSQRSEEL